MKKRVFQFQFLSQWIFFTLIFENLILKQVYGSNQILQSFFSFQNSLNESKIDFRNKRILITCHYSCLTCDGIYNYNCLTCETSKNRILIQEYYYKYCKCLSNYYENNQQCYLCHQTCKTCSGPNDYQCLTCDDNNKRVLKQEQNGKYCKCKDYFYDNGSTQCTSCHFSCLQCLGTSSNQCNTCDLTRNLQMSSCNCKEGYYQQYSNSQCSTCNQKCKTCIDGYTCSSCDITRKLVLQNNQCNCMDGYYLQYSYDINCTQCLKLCEKFSNQTSCTSCKLNTNSVMNNNICICILNSTYDAIQQRCICNQGYFELNGSCIQCHLSCQNCLGPTKDDCKQCDSSKFRVASNSSLSKFQCNCKLSFYEEAVSSICKNCHYSCYKCSGPTSNQCTECNLLDFRKQSSNTSPYQCICQDKYFDNNISSQCQRCHYSCQKCLNSNSKSSCISCYSSYYREEKLNYPSILTKECICRQGYYDDSTNELCKPCEKTCKNCTGGLNNQCTDCYTGFIRNYQNSMCECPPQKFINLQNNPITCDSCHYSCQSCQQSNSISNCTQCDIMKGRVNSNPISPYQCQCQEKTFDMGISQCQNCHITCKTCSGYNLNQCLTCFEDKGFIKSIQNTNTFCVCPSNYYRDIATNTCRQCHYSCNGCLDGNSSSCIECNSDLGRAKLQVTTGKYSCICKDTTYDDGQNSQCQKCDIKCLKCQGGGVGDCTKCLENRNFVQQSNNTKFQCVCSNQFYYDASQNICNKCHYSCKECVNNSINGCKSCDTSKGRFISNQSCPCQDSNTFDNGKDEQCQQCYKFCKTCIGSTQQQCTSCYLDKDFIQMPSQNNYFECTCKKNYFYNNQQGRCIQCHPLCESCYGYGFDQCYSCYCSQNRQISNNNCICMQGYYQYKNEEICQKCHNSCQNCDGPSRLQCTSCNPQYNRKLNHLYKTCDCQDGYFEIELQSCSLCLNRLCKICNKNNQKCLICQNNLVIVDQLNNTCGCQKGYFLNNQLLLCQNCHYSCEECVGQGENECKKCQLNYTPNQVEIPFKCIQNTQKCHYSCLQCNSNNSLICTQCPNQRKLSALELIDGKQQQICDCIDGFFENISTQQCEQCHKNCERCVGSSEMDCLECQNISINFRQKIPIIPTFLFECKCLPGYYEAENKYECQKCHSSCLECKGVESFCTKCPINSFPTSNGECYCNVGFNFIQSLGQCKQCHMNCKTCDGEEKNQCLSCISITRNFKIENGNVGTCNCVFGFYDTGEIDCQKCHSSCQECQGKAEHCLNCPDFEISKRIFIAQENKCACAENYIENDFGFCRQCPYDCKTCDKNFNCLSCNTSERYLEEQSKRCICNIGYYEKEDRNCTKCHPNCLDCQDKAEKCTQCPPNSILNINSQCICNKGYFLDNNYYKNQDQKIQQHQLNFDGIKTRNLLFSEYYRYRLINESSDQLCKQCHVSCKTCTESSYCLTCSISKQTQFNQKSRLCECYYGYQMEINIQNNTFQCVRVLQLTTDTTIKSGVQQSLDKVFDLNFQILQYQILGSILFGHIFVAEQAFTHILDLQLIQYFDLVMPENVNQFLSPIHNNSIYFLLNYINPFKTIAQSEEVKYISKPLKLFNISTNIYREAGGHFLFFIILLVVGFILRQTLFHNRFIMIDQFYKVNKGRIFLSRIYKIFFVKIFIAFHSIISYYLIFSALISLQDQRIIFLIPACFVILIIALSHIYQIKICNTYFLDHFGILKLNQVPEYQLRVAYIRSALFALQLWTFIYTSDLWSLVWTGAIRFIVYIPMDSQKFNNSRYLKFFMTLIQFTYFVVILILILLISYSKQNKFDENQMKILIYKCLAFKISLIIFVCLIQLTLFIDSLYFIVQLLKSNFDSTQVIQQIFPQLTTQCQPGKALNTNLEMRKNNYQGDENIYDTNLGILRKQTDRFISNFNIYKTRIQKKIETQNSLN